MGLSPGSLLLLLVSFCLLCCQGVEGNLIFVNFEALKFYVKLCKALKPSVLQRQYILLLQQQSSNLFARFLEGF